MAAAQRLHDAEIRECGTLRGVLEQTRTASVLEWTLPLIGISNHPPSAVLYVCQTYTSRVQVSGFSGQKPATRRMEWPWKFYHLEGEAKLLRRHTLDRYAGYAQLSAFAPIILFILLRFILWILRSLEARKSSYIAVPASPLRKVRRQSSLGAWEGRFRHLKWWLEDDFVILGQTWGRKDEWVFGIMWANWMMLLSVLETGDGRLSEGP